MMGVVAGEVLELTGFWQSHTQHGWQFHLQNYRSVLPTTEQGIRKYLGSGLIKGIGPKTADKIVNYLGLDPLEVLENQPARLNEVPKLEPHKAGLIAKARALLPRWLFAFTRSTGMLQSPSSRMSLTIWPATYGASASKLPTRSLKI